MDEFQAALEIEKIVLAISKKTPDDELKEARLAVRGIFQDFSEIGFDKNLTLAETISKISEKGASHSLRSVSIFIIRLNSVPSFFPQQVVGSNVDAKIISLLEPNLPNFYKRFNIEKKDQTYEKLDKIYDVHKYACEKLACLNQSSKKIETITADRQSILKAIGDDTIKSYLSPYDFTRIKGSIRAIITQVVDFSNTIDTTFNRRLKELLELLGEELAYCDSYPTFITNDYYRPFVETVNSAVKEEASRSKKNFICDIRGRKGSNFKLEKKYPLHHKSETIRLFIPVLNSGPGIADRVMAYISTKNASVSLHTEEIDLGGVAPGDFVLPVSFTLLDATNRVDLDIIISWMAIGDPEEKMTSLLVAIEAQPPNVDWESLANLNPYSLDIATGMDFHGRRDKINRLASRSAEGKIDPHHQYWTRR